MVRIWSSTLQTFWSSKNTHRTPLTTSLYSFLSRSHKELKEELFCLFVSSFHFFSLCSPLVLHLKPSGWYCRRFSLICPAPAVFLPRPLLLVVLPGRLFYAAHLGVGRMEGTLNLLMQPFVAIASELALPLPGSADRCSRALLQLAAIGYLLLPKSCMCVCACVYVSTIPAAQTKVAHKYRSKYVTCITHARLQSQVHADTNTRGQWRHSHSHTGITQTHLSYLGPDTLRSNNEIRIILSCNSGEFMPVHLATHVLELQDSVHAQKRRTLLMASLSNTLEINITKWCIS